MKSIDAKRTAAQFLAWVLVAGTTAFFAAWPEGSASAQGRPSGFGVSITEAFVTFDDTLIDDSIGDTITITVNPGNLDATSPPVVTLGNQGALGVETVTADQVKVRCPGSGPSIICVDGDFLLTISFFLGGDVGAPVSDSALLTIGAVGLQGLEGIQGIQGDQGDQGVQGIRGNQGIQGIQGGQGIQGLKGDKGDKGDTGPAGSAGTTADIRSLIYTRGLSDDTNSCADETIGIGDQVCQAGDLNCNANACCNELTDRAIGGGCGGSSSRIRLRTSATIPGVGVGIPGFHQCIARKSGTALDLTTAIIKAHVICLRKP